MTQHRALAALLAGACITACSPVETTTTTTSTAAEASASAEVSGGVAMPSGLSRDEQLIWNSLTPDAKAQAAAFIAAGGTLTGFMAV